MSDTTAAPYVPGSTLGNQPPVTAPVAAPIEAPTTPDGRPARTPREAPGSTHKGTIDAEQRARRAAKNLRTASHGGQATHKPCSEYPECNHPKHGKKA